MLSTKLTPGNHLVENFNSLVESQDLAGALWHSTVNAVATTVLALIICSIAGYSFRFSIRARKTASWASC